MIASLLWEYARVKPDFRFIVEPWSVRGYETTQGLVIAAIGVAIIVVALLVVRLGDSLIPSIAITAGVTVFAVVLTVLSGADDVELGWPANWGLAVLAGFVAQSAASRWLPAEMQRTLRRLATTGIWLGTILITGIVIFTPLFGSSSAPLWVIVLVTLLLLNALVLIQQPQQLAVHRLLINGVLMGWVVGLSMSAALRSTLSRLQVEWSLENLGVESVPDLRDLQITSGVMMVWAGGLLAFAGAVAIWAHRREQIEAQQRSQQQLDAARKSAEELGESLHV
jgi:hypothetical protein